jgi:hypothetical protein
VVKPVNNKNLRFKELHTQDSLGPPTFISSIFSGHHISSIPGMGELRDIQPVQLQLLPATGVSNPIGCYGEGKSDIFIKQHRMDCLERLILPPSPHQEEEWNWKEVPVIPIHPTLLAI